MLVCFDYLLFFQAAYKRRLCCAPTFDELRPEEPESCDHLQQMAVGMFFTESIFGDIFAALLIDRLVDRSDGKWKEFIGTVRFSDRSEYTAIIEIRVFCDVRIVSISVS